MIDEEILYFLLFCFAPCSIVQSFDTVGSVFAQQLDDRQMFSFKTENIIFLAEAVSWVACLTLTGESLSETALTNDTALYMYMFDCLFTYLFSWTNHALT